MSSEDQTSRRSGFRRRDPARSEHGADRRFIRGIFAVPRYQLVEVQQLEQHMLVRLNAVAATSSSSDAPKRLADWLASRFTYPMRSMLIEAKRGGVGYVVLNLIVIGGGFATSGIAVAVRDNKHSWVVWIVFTLGLLVAVAGGISQLFRPGHRATERGAIVAQLRQVGWAFANHLQPYDVGDQEAFELLDARLSELHDRANALSALEDLSTQPTGGKVSRTGTGRRR